jgi:hypothetical protein
MRSLVTVFLLIFSSFNALAALVDNGSFTTDTGTGLDWLDITESDDMLMAESLVAFPDWRYATNSEVEGLFGKLFTGYYDSNANGYCSSWSSSGCHADQYQDTSNFISLMGEHLDNDLYCYTGLYFDEDNEARGMGGCLFADGTFRSEVYGMEYLGNYRRYVDEDSYSPIRSVSYGALLVRTTAVPIPAAVWLFGSALAGLGWMRRKKS